MKSLSIAIVLAAAILQGPALFACTVFTASQGDRTLVGNNEDFFSPNTKIWFCPPEKGKFGRVYFGFDDGVHQGGMNDRGLVFDYVATPPVKVTKSKDKPAYQGNLVDKVMEECSTVEEALDVFDRYDISFMRTFQTILVDRTGDAAVIQANGVRRKAGRYLAIGDGANVARKRLGKRRRISVRLFRSILSATHAEGVVRTQYSNIYDLKENVIYVYYFYDYHNPLRLDLEEELREGRRSRDLPSLFPKKAAANKRRYEKAKQKLLAKAPDIDQKVFEDYVGHYRDNVLGRITTVMRQGDTLKARLMGSQPLELIPRSASRFTAVVIDGDFELTFARDETGRVTHVVGDLGSWKFQAKKIE